MSDKRTFTPLESLIPGIADRALRRSVNLQAVPVADSDVEACLEAWYRGQIKRLHGRTLTLAQMHRGAMTAVLKTVTERRQARHAALLSLAITVARGPDWLDQKDLRVLILRLVGALGEEQVPETGP